MTLILNGTDNSATTPAVTGTDTDTGIYYPAANQVAISTNGTRAMLVDASQNVTFAGSANLPNTFGFKNRIINGAMVIDMRNAGASVTPTANAYSLDRWQATLSVTSKFSVQQNAGSVTPPTGYINYLGCTSLSAYTVGAAESFTIRQYIEGLNVADLAWGTASAATVTLSFWVYSSLTGTFGGALKNSASTRTYPFTYTISSANTWTQASVTIAGDTTGTWLTTNGIGLGVVFSIGTGTTQSGTAGAWAATNYNSATGAVSVVGTNAATWYVTGVQLEKGSTATSFDYRPFGTELFLCQRYCQYAGSGANGSFDNLTTTIQIMEKCVVPMRAAPSGSIFSGVAAAFRSSGADISAASPALANFTTVVSNYGGTSFWTQVTGFTGGTANAVATGRNQTTNNGGNFILLTSEL